MRLCRVICVTVVLAAAWGCSIRNDAGKEPADGTTTQDLLDAALDAQMDASDQELDALLPLDLGDTTYVDVDDLGDGDVSDSSDSSDSLGNDVADDQEVTPPECGPGAACAPSPEPCTVAGCLDGVCVELPAELDTPVPDNTAGDCLSRVCDGLGGEMPVPDPTDLPPVPSACIAGICTEAGPGVVNRPAGEACGALLKCDGEGNCVGCLEAEECPGAVSECGAPVCTDGICGFDVVAAGTLVTAQWAGDCQAQVCDGFGAEVPVPDDADLPDDLNPCTDDLCVLGQAGSQEKAAGTPCAVGGGVVCDAAGRCVECLEDIDCGTSSTLCMQFQCVAGACNAQMKELGWMLPGQVPSDCLKRVCTGNGEEVDVPDETDVLVDGNDCTQDLCVDVAVSNPGQPQGFPCAQNGGHVCNPDAVCVQCNNSDDCPSVACAGEICQPPDCADGFKNGTETAADCGGPGCDPCDVGDTCNEQADCALGGCLWGYCLPCGQDAYEPNPRPETAPPLPDGTVEISLCALDRDWFLLPTPVLGVGMAISLSDADGLATYEVRISDCSAQDPGEVLNAVRVGTTHYYALYDLPADATRCLSVALAGSPAQPFQDRPVTLATAQTPVCVLDTDCGSGICRWGGPLAGLCVTSLHPAIPSVCGTEQDSSKSSAYWTAGVDLSGSLCELGKEWGSEWDWWNVTDSFSGGLNLTVTYDLAAAGDRTVRLWLFDGTERTFTEFLGVGGAIQLDPLTLKTATPYWIVLSLEGGDGTNPQPVNYTLHRSLCMEYFVAQPGDVVVPFNRGSGTVEPTYNTSFPLVRTGTPTVVNDACNPIAAGALTGDVALIRRGTCSFNIKVANAQAAGAVGVFVYNNAAGYLAPAFAGAVPVTVAGGGILAADGLLLNSMMDSGPVTMQWMPGYTVVVP